MEASHDSIVEIISEEGQGNNELENQTQSTSSEEQSHSRNKRSVSNRKTSGKKGSQKHGTKKSKTGKCAAAELAVPLDKICDALSDVQH